MSQCHANTGAPPFFAASLCPVQSPLSGFLGQEVCAHGDTLHRTALWSRSSLREDGARTLCHCLRLFSLHTFTLPSPRHPPADCNLLLTTTRSPLDDWTRAFMCERVPLCRGPSYGEHVGVFTSSTILHSSNPLWPLHVSSLLLTQSWIS